MKKGFTLVELLAVIAILAILVIIALPNVMGMFNTAKENSFKTEVKEIFKTAEQTWITDSMYSSGEQVYSRCSSCNGKSLDLTGRSELEYYIKLNQAGKVVEYYATDGTFQYSYNNPDGLKIEDITDVQKIANITNELDKVSITDEGNGNAPINNKIEVCIYSVVGEYNSCRVTRSTINCNKNSTTEECLSKIFYFQSHKPNTIRLYDSNVTPTFSDPNYTLITPDSPAVSSEQFCYAEGTLFCVCLDGEVEIEVYDKKKKKRYKKKLKDITYDDLILVWDFDKGEYVWARPFWIMKPTLAHKSITLTFNDGSILKVIGDHRIFDINKNSFVSVKESKLGLKTINSKNEIIELIKKEEREEEVYAYNVITERHINMFANGILTSHGSNNLYKIENMKFIKEEREAFTKEELSDISKEYIEGLRLNEWIVDDKGNKEKTLIDMHNYISHLVNNKKN